MDRFEHFKNLMVMAAMDGKLTEQEIAFLSNRSARWGIDDGQFGAAVKYALSPDAELVVPARPDERRSLLSELIRMMAADGELADEERHLFATAAAVMEISSDELEEIIDQTLKGA